MKAFILDTDIGTDIDDAFALVYLLKKGCPLAGVTTVYRNADKRAKLCKAIMHSMGNTDVEVYAGLDEPFVQDPKSIEPPSCKQHYDQNGRYIPPQCLDEYDKYTYASVSAVDFMIDTCRKNERTEILAIGALTNVAAALRRAPDIAEKIQITLMGGCLKKLSVNGEEPHSIAEWNILCDPEAAHAVFTSGAKIRMVGLDVTHECTLPQEIFEKIKATNVCPLLDGLMEKWAAYYNRTTPVMYDPVAAASLFCDCLTFEEVNLAVGLEKSERGVTYPSEQGNAVLVAVQRDNEAFYKEFLDVLGA